MMDMKPPQNSADNSFGDDLLKLLGMFLVLIGFIAMVGSGSCAGIMILLDGFGGSDWSITYGALAALVLSVVVWRFGLYLTRRGRLPKQKG